MHRFIVGRRPILLVAALLVPTFVAALAGGSRLVAATSAATDLGVMAAQVQPADAIETTPGVLDAEPALLDCDGSVTGTAVAETPAATYTIVSEDSEARYRAQEELAGQGANEAVGATNAFIGQILFDESDLPLACSRFDVDLRTLVSDESRRDNFLYNNTLETGQYPLATFILTSVEGLDQSLEEGEETTVVLIGDLTLHGVTKAVAWEATVTLDGDTLEGNATTTFDMPDFNIQEPVVGPVIAVDETITLEVDISARQAE